MRDRQYITNLATNIVGKHKLRILRDMRAKKGMPAYLIRSYFSLTVKMALIEMKLTPATLGKICACGENLGDEGFIVTAGTNAWDAMFLSTIDSGRTLLEKIAVATILAEIYRLLNEGFPHLGERWEMCDLEDETIADQRPVWTKEVNEKLGWES